jgi:predicted acetyltransferase
MIQFRLSSNDFLRDLAKLATACIQTGRKGYRQAHAERVLNVCKAFGWTLADHCLVDNEASRRTNLSCGGVYERTPIASGSK